MKSKQAEALYNEGVKLAQVDLQRAKEKFKLALKKNSKHVLALHHLSYVFFQLGKYEKALEYSTKTIKLNNQASQAWSIRGVIFLELGEYRKSINCCNKALEIDPHDYNALFNKCGCFAKLSLFEEVIQLADEIVFKFPKHPKLLKVLEFKGFALTNLGKHKEAITCADKVLAWDSQRYEAWYIKGGALAALNSKVEALNCFEKALQLKPNEPELWDVKGAALNNIGEFQEAINCAEHSITIYTKNNQCESHPWYVKGYGLIGLQRYEEALVCLDNALNIDNKHVRSWLEKGRALMEMGHYEEVIHCIDQTILLKRYESSAWINRSKIVSIFKVPIRNSLLSAFEKNSNINQPGYEGALANLEEGLKNINRETQLQGWGKLHQEIGKLHYRQASFLENYSDYVTKAISSYVTASQALTEDTFPENHLELLPDMIQAYASLGENLTVKGLIQSGAELLDKLISNSSRSDYKKYLALKFNDFKQLTINNYVEEKQLVTAIEKAEESKNSGLTWLLSGWSEEINSPNYQQMQQLLNQTTAIIYWHLSPVALTTFVLKYGEPEPIVINNSQSLQTLLKFETWKQEWDQQYQDYRNKGKKESKPDHSWRKNMQTRLDSLKDILHIKEIEAKLTGIPQLILIPHRDLHRFPLHTLFSTTFVTTYLPSIQMGIHLQSRQPANNTYLLSIENPASDRAPSLGFTRLESQLISQLFHNTQFIQEKDATKENLTAALLQGYNAFHFCGHAIHHPDNPHQSELLLAGKDNLQLGEMYQDNDLSNYDLVSLSACETAITHNQSVTAEYVGLVSGFLSCGVAQVVSTLWTVESAASALVMVEFYRHRHESKSDAKALQEAVQWLKQLTPETLQQWCNQRLEELPPELPTERRGKIKRTLYNLKAQYANIEEQAKQPYTWAAFACSGNFS